VTVGECDLEPIKALSSEVKVELFTFSLS